MLHTQASHSPQKNRLHPSPWICLRNLEPGRILPQAPGGFPPVRDDYPSTHCASAQLLSWGHLGHPRIHLEKSWSTHAPPKPFFRTGTSHHTCPQEHPLARQRRRGVRAEVPVDAAHRRHGDELHRDADAASAQSGHRDAPITGGAPGKGEEKQMTTMQCQPCYSQDGVILTICY